MSADRTPAGAHPGDGTLLALHDGQPVEFPDAQAHVDGCAECRARLERLGADARLVHTALLAVPTPSLDVEAMRRSLSERRPTRLAGASRWRRPAIQIVAALALATAAAASVGPVRTLIARRNRPAVLPIAPRGPEAPKAASRPGTTISFAETGPEFTVRFDSTPARGDLEIDRGGGAEVSAQALTVGDGPADPMVVLPHELRLRNDPTSTATYRIMIPGSVEHVRVMVAGRLLFDGSVRQARIALSSGGQK